MSLSSLTCKDLLLSSLTEFYNENTAQKSILKTIIEGEHKLSLRLIDWFVTHYSKSSNVIYWVNKNSYEIFEDFPNHTDDNKNYKRINVYMDYRAQLKSYAKINFDSFRRHNRITFILDLNTNEFVETTVGQLNFFRWIFKNGIIDYIDRYYDVIYQDMIDNNTSIKNKKNVSKNKSNDITKTNTICTLHFD